MWDLLLVLRCPDPGILGEVPLISYCYYIILYCAQPYTDILNLLRLMMMMMMIATSFLSCLRLMLGA